MQYWLDGKYRIYAEKTSSAAGFRQRVGCRTLACIFCAVESLTVADYQQLMWQMCDKFQTKDTHNSETV
jgi:hypothetical protein